MATEIGPGSDAGNGFQTGAVDDSVRGDDFGCSGAGPVHRRLVATWHGRFS